MSDMQQVIFVLLPVLLISMSIHEMMHAYASNWLGDPTARLMGRLTITPLKHIDPVFTILVPALLLLAHIPPFAAAKPVQVNFQGLRYGEFGGAIVGMIGPVTNFILAAIAALVFNVTHPTPGTYMFYFLDIAIVLNCGLFIFNSIPWPPLDGSRLLYAFAPDSLREFMDSIERTGMLGLAIFILVFYQLGDRFGHLITGLAHLLAPGLVL
jgi:Zn-dependent protease